MISQITPDMEARLTRIAEQMRADGLDAILISSNANLFYATGLFFRGYVYVDAAGRTLWLVVKPAMEPAGHIAAIRKPEQIMEVLGKHGVTLSAGAVLGMELDSLSVSGYARLEKCFPTVTLRNASGVLRRARMVKTPGELALMRHDGIMQTAAYEQFGKLFHPGMTDIEFQIEMERVLRLQGSLGFLRVAGNLMEINLGNVLAGDNADTPSPYEFSMGGAGVSVSMPGGANGTVIRPGMTVMVDMNGNFNGYQTDLTRVWSLGELPGKAVEAHECSCRILRRCEREGIPGTPVAHLARIAEEEVREAGLKEYFMGHRQQAAFIGHGVGIELNEQPVVMLRSRDILQADMTLALEPKFVIPKVGAVGVENTYRVTSGGLENLTPMPEKIIPLD